MTRLLVVITGILTTFLVVAEGGSPACGFAGGVCKNRYDGCENGVFVEDLCGGPIYYQCCVFHPVIDEEVLNRPKWRNCHNCFYSVSRKLERGNSDCLTWDQHGEERGITTVNCTGMCSKELLKLDDRNFQLVRRCNMDCHPETQNPMLHVDCCWGDLCNTAVEYSTSRCLLAFALLSSMCLWMAAYG